jgi:hypothetical protein
VPVASPDDQVRLLGEQADRLGDRITPLDGQRTARREVVLKVDDQQRGRH